MAELDLGLFGSLSAKSLAVLDVPCLPEGPGPKGGLTSLIILLGGVFSLSGSTTWLPGFDSSFTLTLAFPLAGSSGSSSLDSVMHGGCEGWVTEVAEGGGEVGGGEYEGEGGKISGDLGAGE